jgi:hypothetical protein
VKTTPPGSIMTAAADAQATTRAPQRQRLGGRLVLLKGDTTEDWATVRPPMVIGGCRRCGLPAGTAAARGACARTGVAIDGQHDYRRRCLQAEPDRRGRHGSPWSGAGVGTVTALQSAVLTALLATMRMVPA